MVVEGFHDHTSVRCTLPAGTGTSKQVRITVDDQTSLASFFSYDAPQIDELEFTQNPTQGGTPLSIKGANFGQDSGVVSVRVGGVLASVASVAHALVVVSLPQGEGLDNDVVIVVDGQPSNAVQFSYAAPNITNVNPREGPTQGQTQIVVTGTNLGLTGEVTVGGVDCTLPQRVNHVSISCTLPQGQGR